MATQYVYDIASEVPAAAIAALRLHEDCEDAGLPIAGVEFNQPTVGKVRITFTSSLTGPQEATLGLPGVATASDGTVIGDHVAQGDQYTATHEVETTNKKGQVTQIDFYETDNGDGTYADLSKRITNTWQGRKHTQQTVHHFYTDGATITSKTKTETYHTSSGKRVTKRP